MGLDDPAGIEALKARCLGADGPARKANYVGLLIWSALSNQVEVKPHVQLLAQMRQMNAPQIKLKEQEQKIEQEAERISPVVQGKMLEILEQKMSKVEILQSK